MGPPGRKRVGGFLLAGGDQRAGRYGGTGHSTWLRCVADHQITKGKRVTDDPRGVADSGRCDREKIAEAVRTIIGAVGEDPERDGLLRTPERAASSLAWLTRGYEMSVSEVVGGGVFEEPHESMIVVRDIEVYSLCEHHLLPFYGRAHVAYIPNGKIIGLSKIPRIVDVFAQRFQVQERLTDEVADALMDVVSPHGVGVVVEAKHLCMMMRGVEKQHTVVSTSSLRGIFRDNLSTREEFIYRHKWHPHDLLFWDNRCTMHHATSYDRKYTRHLLRTTVKGDRPV